MNLDFNKPATTDNYSTQFVPAIQAAFGVLGALLDPAYSHTTANAAVGTKRYNTNTGNFEVFNGTSWVTLTLNAANSATTSQRNFSEALTSNTQLLALGNQGSGTIATAGSSLGGIIVQGPGSSNPAFMTFHRPGSFATYFGLDVDNSLCIGGWSLGTTRYRILHEGNFTAFAPGLNGAGASGTWGINISGNAATASVASRASTLGQNGGVTPMTFFWQGQGGQPSWVWGGSDGVNHYVYNPANFSVAYAGSAGNVTHAFGSAGSAPLPILFGPAASPVQPQSNPQVTVTPDIGRVNAQSLWAAGQVIGGGGGVGMRRITTTTTAGTPSGMSAGDFVLVY